MASLKSLFRNLELDLVGPDNRRLFWAWCLGVSFVLSLGFFLNSDTVSFLGVAESREFQVSFDNPVVLRQLHVRPGQKVKKGELLLELHQADLETQFFALKSRYDKLSAEIKLRDQIADLTMEGESVKIHADPLKTEWADTLRDIRIIEKRLQNLFYFSQMDGRIGAVNFKAGEKIPSFAPILTVLPLKPTYVNGFINEQLHSSLELGQNIEVLGAHGRSVTGTVVSLGARIVPIPERLLRIQTLPVWGREVVVQIPNSNEFLLGEKVSLRPVWNPSWVSFARAGGNKGADGRPLPDPEKLGFEKIEFPESLTDKIKKPEISGMVYVPELKQFVMISDDYPQDQPFLMLMNSRGEVQSQTIPISGLDKMSDIESISYRDQQLYLLSSLSAGKKGKLEKSREIFAKATRQGMSFQLASQVSLREPLLKAMGGALETDFEVEGHAIRDEDLYLALKNPTDKTREIIILKVKSFERLFKGVSLKATDVSVSWRLRLSLSEKDVEVAVTDMLFLGEDLYLASSFRGKEGSAIWKIKTSTGNVNLVQEFNKKHLEALAYLPCASQFFGVFEGGKSNYLTTLSLSTTAKESVCF